MLEDQGKTILIGHATDQQWTNYTITSPPEISGYQPTGLVVERVRRGLIPPPPMPEPTEYVQTVTRWQTETDPGPGLGFGTQTITETYYAPATEPDPEQQPTGSQIGTSEATASISISATLVTKSILLHPDIKSIMQAGGVQAAALKMLAQGASPASYMVDPSTGRQILIGVAAGSGAAMSLVMSASEYYDVQYSATRTWTVSRAAITQSDLTLAIKSPPGLTSVGSRNWLYTGTSYRQQGGEVIASATYILSDAGGWDPKIYGA